MEKDPSPLDTLRQLKEWLDAGTITPQEFATLKQKLLFPEETGSATASQPHAAEPLPSSETSPGQPSYTTPTPTPEPPRPPVAPEAPATIVAGPIEDPLLPPMGPYGTDATRPLSPEPLAEADYTEETFTEDDTFPEPADAVSRNPLTTVLIVGGIVALLAIVAYLVLGNKESERLTSTTITAADTLTTNPETGPQVEQIELPPAAAPETIRVAPVVPATPAATPDTLGQSAEQTATSAEPAVAAPDPAAETTAQTRIQGVLGSFYEDMQAAPFAASTYFAPQVERFYLMQNTTPAAINEELTKTHFPEFLEAQSQIEPGTLKVSPPVNDGSRVVTYIEKSQALRQSLQKRQQTRAQVRARFDKNFKIVYLRQEKLLENTFTD